MHSEVKPMSHYLQKHFPRHAPITKWTLLRLQTTPVQIYMDPAGAELLQQDLAGGLDEKPCKPLSSFVRPVRACSFGFK